MSDSPELFSDTAGRTLQEACAKVQESAAEIDGVAGIIIYKSQLGDGIEPSAVIAGPVEDPVFLARTICRAAKFQQGIIAQLEKVILNAINELQARSQETDATKSQDTPAEI